VTVGALVMAYGTPSGPDEVEAYYTHIRRGRPPTPDQLADLIRRYEAIGGISPLTERTRAQRDAITTALDALEPGRFVVAGGSKHVAPFIEDAVAGLCSGGVERIVGLVLAPHYSASSVGQYHDRARAASTVPYRGIDDWWDLPPFVEHQAAAVRERLDGMPTDTVVVFTAHSLPERALVDDPYADNLRASARAIAAAAGVADGQWRMGWQSAGRTPDPWIGPDIGDVIDQLAADGRAGVLVVPHGFTADHLEVLYDLDIDAAGRAERAGISFARTDVVNDDGAVMAGVAATIRRCADA
jgi:protoporphyrin/coproporphyrin ferrochelatase